RPHSPPFQGGVAAPLIKRSRSLAGADGVVSKRSRSLLIDIRETHLVSLKLLTTPSARLRTLRGFLLIAQPPLLENGGEWGSRHRLTSHRQPGQARRWPNPSPSWKSTDRARMGNRFRSRSETSSPGWTRAKTRRSSASTAEI